jgi:hypothetical protein
MWIPEYFADAGQFDRITDLRTGTVSFDIGHLAARYTGLL